MANTKELRKLSRAELLELLIGQARENLELKDQLQQAMTELESRQLAVSQSGSIAEAALRLNGVFEAAQAAIDQYRENVERECAEMIAKAKQEAEEIRAAAAQERRPRKNDERQKAVRR